MVDGKAKIDATLCVGCGVCEQLCKFDVQYDHRSVGFIVCNIDQTRDTGMDEGGVAYDGNGSSGIFP